MGTYFYGEWGGEGRMKGEVKVSPLLKPKKTMHIE